MREVRKEAIPSQVSEGTGKDSSAVHAKNGTLLCKEESKLGSGRGRTRGRGARGKSKAAHDDCPNAGHDCPCSPSLPAPADHLTMETNMDTRTPSERAIPVSSNGHTLHSDRDPVRDDDPLLKASEDPTSRCQICGKGDNLLRCGDCRLFCHRDCIGLKGDFIPGAKWLCQSCGYFVLSNNVPCRQKSKASKAMSKYRSKLLKIFRSN